MRVLVTGGSGKTGRRLVSELAQAGINAVAASRHGEGDGEVRFDWTDRETWASALDAVDAVYLVAPAIQGDPAELMIDFIGEATRRGARRFVLLSASLLPMGGPGQGTVHQWLASNAREWAVLRPTWFMQNLSEAGHLLTIRAEGRIYSATGSGRIPLIDAGDIARAAAAALLADVAPNRDFVLTGADLLSYDDVAASIARAAGRDVVHVALSVDELAEVYGRAGLNPAAARLIAGMDAAIAAGAEDRMTEDVEALTGSLPTQFDEFVAANAAVWREASSGL